MTAKTEDRLWFWITVAGFSIFAILVILQTYGMLV